MRSRFSAALVAGGAALLVTASLVGCSASGSPASTGSAAPRSSASASAHAAATTPFVIPSSCLSASEVSNLLGLPEAGPRTVTGSDMLLCQYLTATQDGAIIQYQTRPGATVATLKAQAATPPDGTMVNPISGLGDAAFELKSATGESILMITGHTVIDVAGGATTLERVESLALDVLAG